MGRVTPRTAVVSVVLAGLAACGPVQAGGVPDPQEIAGRKVRAVATIGQIATWCRKLRVIVLTSLD
jgi:hypothetical protein